ncbi:MAG: hypothetical protein GY829_12435 [Gammaproteobacteria bacterium]|nr:hypothetical protein [Gammaproteobacteria bacterium]
MLSQAKIIIAIGLISAFGVLYFLYSSAVADRELLETQYNELVGRTERDKIRIEQMTATAKANEETRKKAEQQVQANIKQISKLENKIAEQKEAHNELQQTLAEHDLKSLIIKKKGLMERIMRRATIKLFNEFETATTRNKDSIQRQDSQS